MSGIQDFLDQFRSIADREYANYNSQQDIHFDWLNEIEEVVKNFELNPEQQRKRLSNISISSQEGEELIINKKLTTIEQDNHKELDQVNNSVPIGKNASPKKFSSPKSSQSSITKSPKSPKSPKQTQSSNSGKATKNSPKVNKASESIPKQQNNSQMTPQTAPKQSKKLEIPIESPQTFQTGSNIFNHSGIRFLDDAALLESDSSSSEIPQSEDSSLQNANEDDLEDLASMDGPPVPYTDTNFDELNQTATSFKDQWLKMIHNKKAEAETPKKPFVFAFEREEEEAMPEVYQISDDECENEFSDDEEIYEKNPIEIHGKTIPNWARGKQLLSQLKRQRHIDPDTIFINFSPTIQLEEIFNQNKSKWQDRSDSGYWDPDKVTPEEVTQFKEALGLV